MIPQSLMLVVPVHKSIPTIWLKEKKMLGAIRTIISANAKPAEPHDCPVAGKALHTSKRDTKISSVLTDGFSEST